MADRDRTHTPASGHKRPGVIDPPRAAAPPESWDNSHTGVNDRPERETTVEAIERRSRETKNAAMDLLSRVDDLRKEARQDIAAVNQRVDNVGQKTDALITVVADLRTDAARAEAQNTVIIKMLDAQNKAREQSGMMKLTTLTAEVEVTKTRALSEIEIEKTGKLELIRDHAATRVWRRKFMYKVLATAAAIAISLAGAFAAGRC